MNFLARGITNARGELILEASGARESLRLRAVLPGVGTALLAPSSNDKDSYEGTLRADASAGLPRPVSCEAGPFKPFLDGFFPGLCLEQSPADLVRLPASFLRYEQEVAQYSPAHVQLRSARSQDGQLSRGDLWIPTAGRGPRRASVPGGPFPR